MSITEGAVRCGFVSMEELLADYVRYQRRHRGLSESSVARHQRYAGLFLGDFELTGRICLSELGVEQIQAYLSGYAKSHGRGVTRLMFSTVRMLLRYLYLERHLPSDLSAAVPTIKYHQLSHVPRRISEDAIAELLCSIDRSLDIGRRDYAIVLILSTYGVRGVHVRQLLLDDILWEENRIVFKATKGGKRIIQHLTGSVGNALLDYLGQSRPKHTSCREVFLTCRGRPKPFSKPGILSGVVSRRLRFAGIELPEGVTRGTHSFRHAFATRMVCGSQPFKHVADMLGHKCINSTMIYTKIDLPTMRQATLEWPEVL